MSYARNLAAASPDRSRARALVLAVAAALVLGGCSKSLDEAGGHTAGAVLIDPHEVHPILVSQEPSSISLPVPASSDGLSRGQAERVADFLDHYRAGDAGNSKLLIQVPSGSLNETSAMRAVGQIHGLVKIAGFADNAIEVQPYAAGPRNAPIRLSYMRYVALGPHCGEWPDNLARDYRNLNYQNFGCAQQRNLAAMVANPADLVTPRTMDPADAERRALVFDRYRQGKSPASEKGVDDNATSKSN